MFRLLLGPISDKGSRNRNESELLSLPLPFLAHLDNLTILIEQPMDEIMLDTNINVSNVAIPHTSNGVVPFTPVMKQHQDMHREHVMDASTMMEFVVILTSRENTMEILQESVDEHVLFMYVYFSRYLN
jgi:hypothetical protein